jgi:alkylation response protein AidB-like acyl-CoA dehydrogenase
MLFGRRLIDMPLTQATLADMWVDIETSREFVLRAARLGDAGGPSGREASLAKMYATEAASRVVYQAQQICGGRGVLRGSEIEALARVIRPTTIYEGASEVQRLIVGRIELGPHRTPPRDIEVTSAPAAESPARAQPTPELVAALALIARTRNVYEQMRAGLASADSRGAPDRSLLPFRLTDTVTALEAAELALAEAQCRSEEGAPTAAAMTSGAVGLVLDAAELVRANAEELQHSQGAIDRPLIDELSAARHEAISVTGSRDSVRMRVSSLLLA